MAGYLDGDRIRAALRLLGRRLRVRQPVKLLVVGGAAGLLIGQLPPVVTTGDVDALNFRPPAEVEEVLRAAAEVGRELSLPANWLNTEVCLFASTLPDDWEGRRIEIGVFGHLRVWAISRLDLIAMKFVAHRPADREHLKLMHVTAEELAFVRRYLDAMVGRVDSGRIDLARAYVDSWEVSP